MEGIIQSQNTSSNVAQSEVTVEQMRGGMEILPPYVSTVLEPPSERNASIPSQLVYTPDGELMVKYLRYNGSPIQHIIDSFNSYISDELSPQLSARSLQLRVNKISVPPNAVELVNSFNSGGGFDLRVVYTNVQVGKPKYSRGMNDLNFYPENARRQRAHYLGAVTATARLYLYDSLNGRALELANKITEVMHIPIMTGSQKCHLSEVRAFKDFYALGEDPYFALGHFIIGGSEKSVVNTEQLRYNKIYVFHPLNSDGYTCRITMPHPTGTKQMQLIISKETKAVELQLGSFKRDPKTKQTRSINIIRALDIINMLFTFRDATGKVLTFLDFSRRINAKLPLNLQESGNIPLFRQLVLQNVPANERSTITAMLSATEAQYMKKNEHKIIEDILSWIWVDYKNRSQSETEVFLREIFGPQLFPTIPQNKIFTKASLMAHMTARLLRATAGFVRADNMNDWTNKQIKTPGKTMALLVRGLWRMTISEAQKKIDNDSTFTRHEEPSDILNRVLNMTPTKDITEKIITAFNSTNYGSRESPIHQNLTDPCDTTTNILDDLGIKTKVDVHTDRKVKDPAIRAVQPTQYGYIDPAKTPDGAGSGIVKNLAISARVTVDTSRVPVDILMKPVPPGHPLHGTIVGNSVVTKSRDDHHQQLLLINGIPEGWCDMELMYHRCVSLRRARVIHQDTELVRSSHMALEIYTDAGRLVRPLLVVKPDGKLALDDEPGSRNLEFSQLLDKGYVEYIGSAECDKVTIATSLDTLKLHQEGIFNCQKLLAEYNNELYSLQSQDPNDPEVRKSTEALKNKISFAEKELKQAQVPYDYMELHPIATMGIAASMMPFLSTNQACRISYQAKMYGQALSIERSNPYRHRDPSLHMAYPNIPFVGTALDHYYGLQSRPVGINTLVAFISLTGDNQEDSILVNKASIDAGKFTYVRTYTYDTVVVNNMNSYTQRLERPEVRDDIAKYYRYINKNGLPSIGAVLGPQDCVIGKTQRNTSDKEVVIDVSEYIPPGEGGVVDDIRITEDRNGLHISVRVRSVRIPEIGDKITPRYSQKTTMGRVVAAEDMPFTEDGTTPDLIVNPHSIPSRMTMGYPLEMIMGTGAVLEGKPYDATGFQPYDRTKIEKKLIENGFSPKGWYTMYNGTTGRKMNALIYMGVTHFQQLIHISREKVQSRAKGQVNLLTRQATKGRRNKGGVLFGIMEMHAGLEHGAAHFLHERLCKQSDAFQLALCLKCYSIAQYDYIHNTFACPFNCGGNVGTIEIPYTFKLLMQYMGSVGIKFKPRVATRDEYLRSLESRGQSLSLEHEEHTEHVETEEGEEEPEEERQEEPEEEPQPGEPQPEVEEGFNFRIEGGPDEGEYEAMDEGEDYDDEY